MGSPFEKLKQRQMPIPEKGLARDLLETQRDINRLKNGGTAEVSLEEAQQTKRRIMREMAHETAKQEKEAKLSKPRFLPLAEARKKQPIKA